MKKIILFIFLAAILASCESIQFDKYPGSKLDSVPDMFRGEYQLTFKGTKKTESMEDSTTVFISKNSFTQIGKKETTIKFLSDSVVISTDNGNYFVSEREGSSWKCTQLIPGDGLIQVRDFYVKAENNEQAGKVLKKYFSNVKPVETSQGKSFIVKMNEKELMKYAKKQLKEINWVLKRVN